MKIITLLKQHQYQATSCNIIGFHKNYYFSHCLLYVSHHFIVITYLILRIYFFFCSHLKGTVLEHNVTLIISTGTVPIILFKLPGLQLSA